MNHAVAADSSVTADSSGTAALNEVLTKLAGPNAIARPGQLEAVTALVEHRERVLVVQATGWGKSMVYWAATVAQRAKGSGPTVVISPLLALMRDQISAAQAVGLRAVTVNSANRDSWAEVFEQLERDEVDILLVSPERLANPKFADQALPLLASAGLLVIDEAHCISDWGFDFRPDYQRVTRLLLQMRTDTPVLATTATANNRVTEDVAEQLGNQTQVLRGPLARASLELSVVPGLSPIERYAWAAQALNTWQGSGIVYCLTVDEAQTLTRFLQELDLNVAAYTGATDSAEREVIEDNLRNNNLKAVVATSALGMGYDKPDLAFCIHLGSPSSPVAYYQQVGRAGRALDHAYGVLLPGPSDERIWEYFATASLPDPDLADQVLAALTGGEMTVPELEAATTARRGRIEMILTQMRVDGCVERSTRGWTATGTPWHYDKEKYEAVVTARRAEANLMRQYASGQKCLMQLLVTALDDPATVECGRCSVCTGRMPTGPLDQASVRVATEFLQRRSRVIEPRLMWPKGVSRKGRIKGCEPGRAVAFADDPGWPALIREVNSADADPSPELLAAVLAVLHAWRPPKPAAIVALPDHAHPRRMDALAHQLSQQFDVPAIPALSWDGPAIGSDQASGALVGQLERQLTISSPFAMAGPVLLLAETSRTRWALTVAATLLREVGATHVFPLVVHLRP